MHVVEDPIGIDLDQAETNMWVVGDTRTAED